MAKRTLSTLPVQSLENYCQAMPSATEAVKTMKAFNRFRDLMQKYIATQQGCVTNVARIIMDNCNSFMSALHRICEAKTRKDTWKGTPEPAAENRWKQPHRSWHGSHTAHAGPSAELFPQGQAWENQQQKTSRSVENQCPDPRRCQEYCSCHTDCIWVWSSGMRLPEHPDWRVANTEGFQRWHSHCLC